MTPSVMAIRRLNTFDALGFHGVGLREPLDSLVLEHLQTRRDLADLKHPGGAILRLRAEGFDRKEIAARLGIDTRTIQRRLDEIYFGGRPR